MPGADERSIKHATNIFLCANIDVMFRKFIQVITN
jgi:hypothetical protein